MTKTAEQNQVVFSTLVHNSKHSERKEKRPNEERGVLLCALLCVGLQHAASYPALYLRQKCVCCLKFA